MLVGLAGVSAVGAGLWMRREQKPPQGGQTHVGTAAGTATFRFLTPSSEVPASRVQGAERPGLAVGDAAVEVHAEGARRPAPLPKATTAAAETAALSDDVLWSQYHPTREELEYRASMIERQAGKELQNLLQVLDLDEERQDRVFAALVRSSDDYHPSLQPQGLAGGGLGSTGASAVGAVGGAAATADGSPSVSGPTARGAEPAADLVLAELTPEEAGVYERYTSEREAFWAGVVEDVERQITVTP
jgi:hypothetical protein